MHTLGRRPTIIAACKLLPAAGPAHLHDHGTARLVADCCITQGRPGSDGKIVFAGAA